MASVAKDAVTAVPASKSKLGDEEVELIVDDLSQKYLCSFGSLIVVAFSMRGI